MIPGIKEGGGLVGPPLDHMARRIYIAGMLRNTPANIVTWLRDPIERTPTAPVEPEWPEGYRPSSALEAEIAELRHKQQLLDALEGWLSHRGEEPVSPTAPTDMPAAEVKALADRQTAARTRWKLINEELGAGGTS